jgi:Domain of unknown function (DUF6484)
MNARVIDQTADPLSAGHSGELDTLLQAPSTRRVADPGAGLPAAVCLGRIVSLDEHGNATVEFPGSGAPVAVRLAVQTTSSELLEIMNSQRPAVLVFENGDRTLPIVTGFLRELSPGAPPGPTNPTGPAQIIEADVDGKRVQVVGQDEIVLRCGDASITLRSNGRVVIRGTYIETHSEGTNRIQGGQVRIN